MVEKVEEKKGGTLVDPKQVADAAQAGLLILGHESCLIPNKSRNQVVALEMILSGLATGKLMLVTPEPEKKPRRRKNAPSKK